MRRSPFVRILGALALISSEASIGGLSHGLGLVPRSQRSGLVKRRRVQAPATATDRIAQVTIGAYVAQVARPSLAALGARSTRLILRAGQWWRLATPMLLHGSPAHLMVNMLALRNVGGCVEIKQRDRSSKHIYGGLREPPRHRADAVTGTESHRWRETSAPSSRHSYGVGRLRFDFHIGRRRA